MTATQLKTAVETLASKGKKAAYNEGLKDGRAEGRLGGLVDGMEMASKGVATLEQSTGAGNMYVDSIYTEGYRRALRDVLEDIKEVKTRDCEDGICECWRDICDANKLTAKIKARLAV